MPIYEFYCPACHETQNVSQPLTGRTDIVECFCGGDAKRVFGVPDVTFDGGRHNFRNEPSLGEQRRRASKDLDLFLDKMKRQGGSYSRDEFALANPRGARGVRVRDCDRSVF